jgi:diguanylate cyclase (GGDEF)-like protein
MRHKNGTWRVLESSASVIRDSKGEVDKLVIVNRDITEQKRVEEQLEHNAWHDALTGLPNRRRFVDQLQRAYQQAQCNPEYKYGVLVASIDEFETLTDAMGSNIADHLIVAIGQRLSDTLRNGDMVGCPDSETAVPILSRLEGEDFPILLEGISEPSDAMRLAKRLQHEIAAPFMIQSQRLDATLSIGIALSSTPHERAEDLLRDASIAARRAKVRGRSCCELFDVSMHTRAVDRLNLEAALHTAIDRNQFMPHYQPIVRFKDDRVIGFEALLRWHRGNEILSPSGFIGIAEQSGLIVPIGERVIREACQQVRFWQGLDLSSELLQLTIKVSGKQFTHPDFLRTLGATLSETQIPRESVALELTESVAMLEPRLTEELLGHVKRLGVGIIIDHFGTGHMPLASLLRFPIDALKVDRTLTGAVLSDRNSAETLSLILTVANKLKLQVIAEGIESVLQFSRLKGLGCEFGQGYFFSKPVDARSAEQLLIRARAAAAAKL